MRKYRFLLIIYLGSALAASASSSLGIDVQGLYRVPLLNIRWIDIAILLIVGSYCYTRFNKSNRTYPRTALVPLCFVFLLFQFVQFVRTWHATETNYQIAGLICILTFFIFIDLATFVKDTNEIFQLLKHFAFWGAIVIIVINLYLIHSFLIGNVIHTDLDTRIAIEISGAREVVSVSVLIPFVYAFSLYYIGKDLPLLDRVVYTVAILSIYASLVLTFHRGNLITVILITIIHLTLFTKNVSKVFSKVLGVCSLLVVCYLLFGNTLRKKGYDPIDKLMETAQFAFDVDNPDWDKGRSLAREYEIEAWQKHPWSGMGFDDPHNSGLPDNIASAHNFIVTSLFHNGIIGTALYLSVLFILFRNSIKLSLMPAGPSSERHDMIKLLSVVSLMWLIPFWTQEVMWEKYSLSVEFIYLGILTNLYYQRKEESKPVAMTASGE